MSNWKALTKRILAIAMAAACLMAVTGCSNDNKEEPNAMGNGEFMVGFAKVEITPSESVPMAGYGNTSSRMSTGYLDRLYTHCAAITDAEGETVLLFHNDLQRTNASLTENVRYAIFEKTGIPEDHIMIGATHTHSGPDLNNGSKDSITRYSASMVEWMTSAAEKALADRKPAEMYIGTVEIPDLNRVRHYVLEDGTKVGYASMVTKENPAVAHNGPADETLQIVKFTREGGTDVLLTNWQVHNSYTGGAQKYTISADVVGVFCEELGKALGCDVAYFQGAAGNVSYVSSIQSEKDRLPETYKEYGMVMVNAVLNAGDIYEKVETGKVQVQQTMYTGVVDHTQDDMIEAAQAVQDIWTKTNDRKEADALGAPLGIRSPYHAGAIITRAALGQSDQLEMNVVSFGDVAFAVACYEMFTQNGLHIKEASPYKMTFIMGYANSHMGYMPSEDVFTYESYERDTTHYVQGTAEELAEVLLTMLNSTYENR